METVLHQVIAAESSLQEAARKLSEEAQKSMGRSELFTELIRDTRMKNEEDKAHETHEEVAMTTTVADKLDYVWDVTEQYLDCFATKEATNQKACANVIVDGVAVLEDVPATVLLGLEGRLAKLRSLYEAIPTLKLGVKWERTDVPNVWEGIFPEVRNITKKVPTVLVKAAATDKHPAQTEVYHEDVVIGSRTEITRSGMLPVAEKAQLISNIDKLILAVKDARTRANCQPIVDTKIGSKIRTFIHKLS